MLSFFNRQVHRSPMAFSLLGRFYEGPSLERRVARRGDDFVLEGYPRSANSYATQAFRMAQPQSLNIANHFHSPMQIHLAYRYGIPAAVVYRHPLDAALSLVVFYQGERSAHWALERYISFHQSILSLPGGWVPISMAEIIGPMSVWITRINQKFGTKFLAGPDTLDWDSAVKSALETRRLARFSQKEDVGIGLARQATPSAHKARLQERYRSQFDAPSILSLKTHAMDLFSRLEEIRDGLVSSAQAGER